MRLGKRILQADHYFDLRGISNLVWAPTHIALGPYSAGLYTLDGVKGYCCNPSLPDHRIRQSDGMKSEKSLSFEVVCKRASGYCTALESPL